MRTFTQSDLETFFALLNTKLIPRGGTRYMASCPLGGHAHGDKHPSMSVNFYGLTTGFKCFTCQEYGTIRHLAKVYNEQSGDSRPLEFIRGFDDKSSFGERAMKKGSYEKEQAIKIARMYKKAPQFKKPISEEELKYYLEEYPDYAIERGLSPQSIIKFEIGYDPDEQRMIVPVRDMHGKLMGVSGRALDNERKPKWKHYPGLNKELVLYGENFIDMKFDTCFIVEGFLDVIRLSQIGLKNTLATMGTSISEIQMQKIYRFFKKVIFIPDGIDVEKSNAGLKFAEIYGKKLLIKIPKVGIAGVQPNPDYKFRENPKQWDPSDFRYNIIQPLYGKDPKDLNAQELKKVLQQSQLLSLI